MGDIEPQPRYVRYPRKTDAQRYDGAAGLTRRSQEIARPFAAHGFIPLITVLTAIGLSTFEKSGDRLCLYGAVVGILSCLVGGVLTIKRLGTALGWNSNLPIAIGGAMALNSIVWWMVSEGKFVVALFVPLFFALLELGLVSGAVTMSLRRRLPAVQPQLDGFPSHLPPGGQSN